MKVLLVDDHPLILAALRSVIEGLGDDVTVVGAESAAQARRVLAGEGAFDLLLLDLALGDADGFDVLVEVRAAYPAMPVVVLSGSDRGNEVIRALDLGAMGFVPKRSSTTMLFEALRLVMSGGLYVPPAMHALNPMTFTEGELPPRGVPAAGPVPAGPPSLDKVGLTPRQSDVLGLLLKGLPNKLIARELNVSVDTVKDHVAAVLRALGVNSRTQAVLAVSQMTQSPGGFSAWKPH
jgi:DNA-binding NarL/FixJ family response regulator